MPCYNVSRVRDKELNGWTLGIAVRTFLWDEQQEIGGRAQIS